MSRAARFFWVCAASMVLCAIALDRVSAELTVVVDGKVLRSFDVRFFGYLPTPAREYLGALSPDQITSYLGLHRQLDTLFPALVFLTFVTGMWINRAGAQRFGARRIGPMVGYGVALAYLAFDLSENAFVAALLKAGSGASDAMITQTSLLTISKWIAVVLSFWMLLALWWCARKDRGRT